MKNQIKKHSSLFVAVLLPLVATPAIADQVVIHNIPDNYSFGVDAFSQEYPTVFESATLGRGILVSVFSDFGVLPNAALQVVADNTLITPGAYELIEVSPIVLSSTLFNPTYSSLHTVPTVQSVFLVDFSSRDFCAAHPGTLTWQIHFTAQVSTVGVTEPITTLVFGEHANGDATASRWIWCG